jgi:large subunit ribosomal protein L32
MRHTKGHTRNRRSHHALKEPHLVKCQDCGELHLKHRVCENCGKYRGKVILDVEKATVKKEKKAKEKRLEMEQAGKKTSANKDETTSTDREAVKPLDAGDLSKK